jgi:hypothetical protein
MQKKTPPGIGRRLGQWLGVQDFWARNAACRSLEHAQISTRDLIGGVDPAIVRKEMSHGTMIYLSNALGNTANG